MGIFDKIKKSLEKAKEDKIQSDPKLKSLWAKAEESAAAAKKDADELAKKYGFSSDDDNKDDD
jgi:hypothetical protein